MDARRIGAAGGALSLNAALIALALGSFAQGPDTREAPVPMTVVLLAAAERAPLVVEPAGATPEAAVAEARSAPAAEVRATAPVARRTPATAPDTRSAPPSAPRVALSPPAPSPARAPAQQVPEAPSPPALSPPAAARPGAARSGIESASLSEDRSAPQSPTAPTPVHAPARVGRETAPALAAAPLRVAAAAQATEARRTGPMVDADWRGNPRPPYPELAQRLGEQGEVRIDVFVGTEGRVLDVRLTQSSGSHTLDETALRTVRRWRFLPATLDGKPIAQWYHDWQWVFRLDT